MESSASSIFSQCNCFSFLDGRGYLSNKDGDCGSIGDGVADLFLETEAPKGGGGGGGGGGGPLLDDCDKSAGGGGGGGARAEPADGVRACPDPLSAATGAGTGFCCIGCNAACTAAAAAAGVDTVDVGNPAGNPWFWFPLGRGRACGTGRD